MPTKVEQILENEQWKSGGNCNQCRKTKYCKTRCTQNKKLAKKLAEEALWKAFNNQAPVKVFKQMEETVGKESEVLSNMGILECYNPTK